MLKSKFILTIVCLAAALAPNFANAEATRITSYNALLDALINGHRVMAISETAKCTVTENDNKGFPKDSLPDPDLDAIIGINFTSNFFLRYRDNGDKRYHVLAIATNMVTNAEGAPMQRVKQIKIYDDNTASVYAAAADFPGKSKGHIKSICEISNGHDQNGLSIFDYDAV